MAAKGLKLYQDPIGFMHVTINCSLTIQLATTDAHVVSLVHQHQVSPFTYHVIGITESWCNESISDGGLYLKRYNLFRTDNGNGDGILLYLHKSLPPASLCDSLMSFDVDDSLWCSVRNSQQLLIGIVYCSLSSSDTNNSRLLSVFMSLNNLPKFF